MLVCVKLYDVNNIEPLHFLRIMIFIKLIGCYVKSSKFLLRMNRLHDSYTSVSSLLHFCAFSDNNRFRLVYVFYAESNINGNNSILLNSNYTTLYFIILFILVFFILAIN